MGILHLRSPRHLPFLTQGLVCLLLIWLLAILARYNHEHGFTLFGGGRREPSVHLVLATMQEHDYEWTNNLTMSKGDKGKMYVVPYVADDGNATFRPVVNKGNEAMVILTYLHDFYDHLPDITIFTHGQDWAWHVDTILEHSTAYALDHLDLAFVQRRGYVNLRIDWTNACPDWIHTDVDVWSTEYNPDLKGEEPFMRDSFVELFPNMTVPAILAQPCCSQFAVTKELIRSRPREQYRRSLEWLQSTPLPDAISGRIWEHLWQYMFLQQGVDCPDEKIALCMTYKICFENETEWLKWVFNEKTLTSLMDARVSMKENGVAEQDEPYRFLERDIKEVEERMWPLRERAIEVGKMEEMRRGIVGEEWL